LDLSEETIRVCLDILNSVVVSPTEENCDEKWRQSRQAVIELKRALEEKCQQQALD
jgi:hypothetical protein